MRQSLQVDKLICYIKDKKRFPSYQKEEAVSGRY